MSIDTNTKHRLLLEYNRKRQHKYEDYMMKKTQNMQTQPAPVHDPYDQDAIDVECKALYKKLAEDHKNKDV